MKKRILALLLSLSLMVSVVVPGTVAMDGGDTVDDTYTELAVNDRKTLHASQFGISAEPYQWQISIGGAWINISGETSDSITVSYAMLCNALSGDTAQVRCVGYDSDGTLIEPDAMTIRITEEVAPTPVEQEETHPAGTVLEQAKPLGDPIIEKIEGESEDIKDQIKEKFDEFKDNAKDALDQIKDSAKEKLEELKNKIDEKNDPEPIDQTEETSAETTAPAETTAEPASTDDSAATDDSVVTGGSETTNVETDTAPTTDEDSGDDDVSDQPEMTETTGEAEPENPADSEDKTPAAEEPADTTTEQEVTTSAPETEAPETDAPVATEPSEGSDEDQTEDIVISAPSFASPLTDEKLSAEQEPPITEGNDTQTPPPAPAEQTPPTSPSDPVTPPAPEKQEEPTGNTENTDETQKTPENEVRNDVPSDEQNNVPTVTDSANAVPASDPENGQENDTPAGETTEPTTYTILINYQFADGKQAAPSWSATVATGSTYKQDIQSPVVVGYKPDQTIVEVNASKETTIKVTYSPDEVDYTVKHYQQNVSNDDYTLIDTETKKGFTENAVGDKLAKTFKGFYSLLYDTTVTISADGSTVVEIYYDRYYYLMTFDLDGGYGVEPIYARYGAPISVGTPTKAGYTFAGWDKTIPTTMPAEKMSYIAQWNTGNVKYVVQYWQENANDDDYSFVEQVTKTAIAGDVVSGSNDKSYAGFSYNGEKTDTNITVSGDNSTVVNVYYKRNVYQVKFYEYDWLDWTEDTSKRITAKYGAYIGDKWPGNGWYVSKNGSTAQSNLATMPLGGKNFYGEQTGDYTSTAKYYVETLPGNPGTVQVSGKSYFVHHVDSAKYDKSIFGEGLTVTDEDRYQIEGFTCNTSISSRNGDNYNGAKFYYTRNSYDLVFDDQYGNQVSEKLPFEQTLSESVKYKNNYEPNYPNTLESGAYMFGGWYTDPGCTHPVDWTTKMPAAKVILYAKWTPTTHTVKTYLTKDAMEKGEAALKTWDAVPHGTAAMPEAETPINGQYTFVGWFYINDADEEKAFDFSMPVNRDLNLYAKWRSDSLVTYTIRYQLEGEDGTEIADPTTGSALAGTTKTFEAKTGSQLNAGYQSGYFPQTSSHSLTFKIEGENEFVFVYVKKDKVSYTVKYLEKDTGKELASPKTAETSNAVITEKFVQIKGYAPDAYQKRLVLSAENNVITFWYTKDETHAPVQIIHWTQNIAGDGYTEYQSSTDLNGVIGQTYTEDQLTIPGFTYNTDKSNASGTLTAQGLVLSLYYDRIEYPYEFRFLEQGTNRELAESVTGNARYQAQVTQTAKTIPGYKLVTAENQAITIAVEDPADTASKNVKTFYYVEDTVDIKYQVVGPTGSGTLDNYQDNGVGVLTGKITGTDTLLKGSAPTATDGFRFAGWFKDEACTIPVDEENWVSSNKLTPQTTKNYGTTEEPIMCYETATYYAKFEYNKTSLTIRKTGWDRIDENQSFIFKVTGDGLPETGLKVTITPSVKDSVTIAGLTVGKTYNVTEESGWSWRYRAGSDSLTLEADAAKNVITISNTRAKSLWLNGCAYTENRFGTPSKH